LIILNASNASVLGMAVDSVYCARKAAVRSFARTWTTDLRHRKIRVSTPSPGPTDTPTFETAPYPRGVIEGFESQLIGELPMGRTGRPEEVASAALFLASDDSSVITGIETLRRRRDGPTVRNLRKGKVAAWSMECPGGRPSPSARGHWQSEVGGMPVRPPPGMP
jgi:NAD(P)-dependent dehydrogenase (short-subunit alcohol dehydrogenase family)